MENSKDIKVYGILKNHTVDPSKSDSLHNDLLAHAYQLFDERFHTQSRYSQEPITEKYQDNINKRVTGIKYIEGEPTGKTIIEGDLEVTGDTYVDQELYVDGDAHFHNDIEVEGDTVVNNLIVNGDTNLSLNDLADVNVEEVRDGQALVYDKEDNTWKPGNTDGITKLGDLEDVDTTGADEGDTLVFDDDTNTWVHGTPEIALGDLTDVNIENPQNGNILIYKDGEWVIAEDGQGNPIDFTDILNRLVQLESLWKFSDDNTYLEPATNTSTMKVRAHSFYDTSVE